MPLDVAALRAATPGVDAATHLNAAGASLPTRRTRDTVVAHLERESRLGGYDAADDQRDRLDGFYRSVARLVGAGADEVAYVESATVGWYRAFAALTADVGAGDVLLTSRAEYASNAIAMLQVVRRTGAHLEVVPDDTDGQLDVAALADRLGRPDGDRVRLVSVSHVPTQSGLVQPAAEIGRVTRAAGVPYLLDACQSAGQVPLDVAEVGCDVLTATGRKYLRGPRGTGFLVVRRPLLDTLEPWVLDLLGATWTGPDRYEVRPDARRFETWERSVANQLGLAAAVDQALELGVPSISERVAALAATLRDRLAAVPGVTLHDPGRQRCGIVSFTVADRPARELAAALRDRGILVRASAASSAVLDFEARGLDEVVRASVHVYNHDADLARLVDAVTDLAGARRSRDGDAAR